MIERDVVVQNRTPGWLIGLSVAGLVLALGSLGWAYGLQNHVQVAENRLTAADQRNQALSAQLEETNERLKAEAQTLGQSVGLTQKQLEERSSQLISAQRTIGALNNSTKQLAKQVGTTKEEVSAVQTDVNAVKTDVGGVKTSVATTQADLAETKTSLTRVIGDAGVMSGLIATNHDELEQLKHRGDRNYYEFTLQKGEQPKLLSTVKLALKKADPKHSKFTLYVNSDDKQIEKKDRNLNEPIQFYSGKSPMLFEIVVNSVDKNRVVGYLSTPKNAPQPLAVQ